MPGHMLRTIPVHDIASFTYQGKESDFYANSFRMHIKQHHHLLSLPHRHSFYFSILCTRGSGTHEIDFHTYNISPGSVFLMSPGQVHFFEVSEDIDGYVILHTREFYDLNFAHEKVNNFPFFLSIQNTPLIRLGEHQKDPIELLYRLIVEEYRGQQLMRFQKMGALLNVLYIDLSRLYLPDVRLPRQQEVQLAQVRRLELLVEEHFREIKLPGKYAEMMFISERSLNRVCRSILNRSVSEIISDKIILEAKRMLIYTKLTVTEISAELGYLDNSYFTRLFRKKTGQTPVDFQKAYRREKEGRV